VDMERHPAGQPFEQVMVMARPAYLKRVRVSTRINGKLGARTDAPATVEHCGQEPARNLSGQGCNGTKFVFPVRENSPGRVCADPWRSRTAAEPTMKASDRKSWNPQNEFEALMPGH